MSWKFTHIKHPERIKLGLSNDEYCLLDMLYRIATHPSTKPLAWCGRSKKTIAQDLGLSESTVKRIITAMKKKGFLETNQKGTLRRATPAFYNVVYNQEGGQNDPGGVNVNQFKGGQYDPGGVNVNPQGGQYEPPGGVNMNPTIYSSNKLIDNSLIEGEEKDNIHQLPFSEKEKIPKKRKKFTTPILSLVEQFFIANNSTKYEAQNFHLYYRANGWLVGRVKMKDWQASSLKWIRNNKKDNSKNFSPDQYKKYL